MPFLGVLKVLGDIIPYSGPKINRAYKSRLSRLFSGQLIPKSRQCPVNIGSKIFLGRSETGGDFFLSPVSRLFNASSRRNRHAAASQGGGKPRSAAPEFGFNSDG
jgi:hypothetical protein